MSKTFLSSVKRASKNVKGLVTSYEVGVTPAYHKTMKTDKSTRLPTEYSQRTFGNRQEQEDEDFPNSDDYDSIFINPEEEKKIHNLLDFARQGKISPANAFEIPLTVLDPDITQTGSLRFWKFASELLGASICIYDKRVEGMFQLVNKTFTNFVRTNNNQVKEEPQETAYSKSRRKKGEAMTMEIAEMRENPNVSMLEVGRMNLEESHKINVKNSLLQYQSGILFQKTLQAFDSNSLKSLFLNIFQLGKSLEISFFSESVQLKIEYEKIEVKEMEGESSEIYNWLGDELKKLEFIAKNSQIYIHLSRYITCNALNDESETRLDISMQFKDLKSIQFDITRHSTRDDQMTQISDKLSEDMTNDKFSFHYVSQLDQDISLTQSLNHSQRSMDSRYPISQQCSNDFMVIEEDQWSVLTPRELEFRGLKLLKKKANPLKDQLNVRRKRNNSLQSFSFSQYLMQEEQCRSQILKICKPNEPLRSRSYEDKFLVAKSMDPFIDIHRRRKKAERDALSRLISQMSQRKISEKKCDETMVMQGRNDTTVIGTGFGDSSLVGSFCFEEQMSTEGIKNMNTYGLRSIRQIKQSLADRLQREKQLILSQLWLPVSPASSFIILLHLVNEHSLHIRAIDCERDIAITKQQAPNN